MSFGLALAGGIFGRLNEIVKENDALELAKAKNADTPDTFNLMSWIQGDMKNADQIRPLIPNMIKSGVVRPQDIPLLMQVFQQADSNTQFFGNKQWEFTGYKGDKEAGNLAYHDGMLSGLNKSLNTKEARLKFLNLYNSDENFKTDVNTFLNRNMTLYKYKFRDELSGEKDQGYGAITPNTSLIFENFNAPELQSIFQPVLSEYYGDDENNPNFIAGIGDSGDTLKVYNKGSLTETKVKNGVVVPHYDVYEVSLNELVPNMTKGQVLGGLQQMAEKQNMTVPSFLSTINPDLERYQQGDDAGAFEHLKIALSLNLSGITKMDPQQGSGIATSNEKDRIMDILFSQTGTQDLSIINEELAVKAVSLHMLSNKRANKTVSTGLQSVESYITDLSGLKTKDIEEGKNAANKSIELLKDLENAMDFTNTTGFAQNFVAGFSGIFGSTGQIAQIADKLGFDMNDATTKQTITNYQKQFGAIDLDNEIGRARAIKITLAFALARAEDPSGRLSNQDVEAQLVRLGGNATANMKQARGAIQQTLKDTENLLGYYNVFSELKGQQSIKPVQQRELDARYVVHQLKKRYMSQLKDSLRGKEIDSTFGETSI